MESFLNSMTDKEKQSRVLTIEINTWWLNKVTFERYFSGRWYQIRSDQISHSVVSDSLGPHESQHARPPAHHQLPEFTETHVHQVGDTMQPSNPLSSPTPAPNPSKHQSLFQWVNSSHEVAKVLKFQLEHHSFQRNPVMLPWVFILKRNKNICWYKNLYMNARSSIIHVSWKVKTTQMSANW